MIRPVDCAVEGSPDEYVARRLLDEVGLSARRVFSLGGKTNMDPKLPGYNRSAAHSPWLVLRDLDHDDVHQCIPNLRSSLLGGPPASGMCFRLAVREVESWLMADVDNCASFLGVGRKSMPLEVESRNAPKQDLINLARKSRKRDIREGMVPPADSRRRVGPEYTALLREFVQSSWDPQAARSNAPSLDRAMRCLERLHKHFGQDAP